ncbi:hypothetical protein SAMN04487898_12574 [Pedobacter sp. ok626]|nr:hypothetical protein SAMN04487898_12574 [Pedobacter sp. ok626]
MKDRNFPAFSIEIDIPKFNCSFGKIIIHSFNPKPNMLRYQSLPDVALFSLLWKANKQKPHLLV